MGTELLVIKRSGDLVKRLENIYCTEESPEHSALFQRSDLKARGHPENASHADPEEI